LDEYAECDGEFVDEPKESDDMRSGISPAPAFFLPTGSGGRG